MKTMLKSGVGGIPGNVVLKNWALWWSKDKKFLGILAIVFQLLPWGEPIFLLEQPLLYSKMYGFR